MYDVVELAGLDGSEITQRVGWRVNSAGQVAGFVVGDVPSPFTQAFLWQPARAGSVVVTWLGDINTQPGDLNNLGQVAGWWSADLSGEYRTAYLWNPPNLGQTVLRLPGVDQEALGINDAGQVVGWYELDEQGAHTAYVWDPIKGVQSLPSLGDNTSSQAHAINSSGLIVGRSGAQPGVDEVGRAVVWMPGGGGSYNLVELAAPPDWVTVALTIDQYGRIAGSGYPPTAGPFEAHALCWFGSPGFAPMTDLGTLGQQYSSAQDLNNLGEIVGTVSDALDGNRHAFHWAGGTMINLNDQIPSDSGWLLEEANGINDAGVIVGVGLYQGQDRAFRLTPRPESQAETFANAVRGIVVAAISFILFGLRTDGGGAVIQPGGIPIPIPPNPTWDALPTSTQDILVGLVTNEIARLVQNPAARRQLQRAALELVREEVTKQLRALADG